MSPFDFILLPDDFLPGVGNQKQADGIFDEAGFKIKKSMFLEGVLFGQLAIFFIGQNVIFGVLFVISKQVNLGKLNFVRNIFPKIF